jgi:hypothetical protein
MTATARKVKVEGHRFLVLTNAAQTRQEVQYGQFLMRLTGDEVEYCNLHKEVEGIPVRHYALMERAARYVRNNPKAA